MPLHIANDSSKNLFHRVIALLLASIGIGLCAILLGGSRAVGYRFVWIAAFALLAVGNDRFMAMEDVRAQRYFGGLGALFAIAQAMGYRLQFAQQSGLAGLFLCLGIGLCFAPALAYLFTLVAHALGNIKLSAEPTKPGKVFWISLITILICWAPVFLAYYPGLFTYDVGTQIGEIISGKLTNRNPLIHTLFLGGFYLFGGMLGSYSTGIAMAVLLQMLAMAAIFAYLLRYLAILRTARFLRVLALLLFAVLPIHSMLAISCTKDTLFSGLLLLFAIRLHQLSREPGLLRNRRWLILTMSMIVLICLLRNNAFFAIFLCIPLGFLIIPKGLRMRFTVLLMGSLLVYFGGSMAIKGLLHADGISPTELVSVPSQQMSRVYMLHHEELPASVEIEYYLPTVRDYTPYSADPVKTFAIVNHPYRMWGFLKLWGKIGLKYPIEYLDAFLFTNRGYWWLDDTTHAAIYGEGLATRQGYLLSDTKKGMGVEHTSLFPPLETLFEKLFSNNEYQRFPGISLLFAPSLYVWLTLFSLFCGMYLRKRALCTLSGFLLCYLLPLSFGACVLIRYVYPLIVCLPLLLALPGDDRIVTDGESLSTPDSAEKSA